MKTEIYDKIISILEEQCEIETNSFHKDLDLQKDLGLDSMGLLTLATEIENYWELYLNEEEQLPQTLEDLACLVEVRLNEKTAH